MAEKSGLAQFLDRLVEGMSKNKESSSSDSNVANVLPKPNSQEIGQGLISWKWVTDCAIVESVYATSSNNSLKLPKNQYKISVEILKKISGKNVYQLDGQTAKQIGQSILSAYNWQDIWKLHAGEFLVETDSLPEPEILESSNIKDDA